MRIVVWLILILTCQLFAYSPGYAQAVEDPAAQSELDPLLLIREWFLRLNALDDWSPDNLENQVEEESGEPESEETLQFSTGKSIIIEHPSGYVHAQ